MRIYVCDYCKEIKVVHAIEIKRQNSLVGFFRPAVDWNCVAEQPGLLLAGVVRVGPVAVPFRGLSRLELGRLPG